MLLKRRGLLLALGPALVIGCNEPPSQSDLISAAGRGDVRKLRALLDAGGEVDGTELRGYTPLAVASFNGQTEAMRLLLDRGANLNAGRGPSTALAMAVTAGHSEAVKLLIERGADVDLASNGDTLLGMAADREVASLLLGHGVKVNQAGQASKNTALHDACSYGRLDVMKLLLERNAKPNVTNGRGQTPLHVVCGSRFAGVLYNGKRPADQIVRALLGAGANPNVADLRQNLPIHAAARNVLAGPQMVRMLIDAGSLVTARNAAGRTPLEVALDIGRSPEDPVVVLLGRLTEQREGKERFSLIKRSTGTGLDSDLGIPPQVRTTQ